MWIFEGKMEKQVEVSLLAFVRWARGHSGEGSDSPRPWQDQ